jgi:hypothetical protein
MSFSTTRWNFSLFWQYFSIKNCYLEKVVFIIWASAFWQCLQSSNQVVYCHLGPHEEEVGEESNTDSQTAENKDNPQLSGKEEWSSQQAVCCHLRPHEEEAKEESNTDSQPDEDEDDDGGCHY